MTDPTREPVPSPDRHLWQWAAVRDVAVVVGVVAGLGLLYLLRALIAPVVVGFALAYVVDPVARWAQRRLRLSRTAFAVILVVSVLGGALVASGWLLPELIEQTAALVDRLPDYSQSLFAGLDEAGSQIEAESDGEPTPLQNAKEFYQSTDPQQVADALLTGVGRLFGFAGTIISTATYLVVATLLILIFFVWFVARFDRLAAVKQWLPASRRDYVWTLLGKVDDAFSAYVRGQFIVAAFTTIGFCAGFWVTGVPYWFVVSLVGGVLSLVPYGQMSGWALAILLKYLEAQTGDATLSWASIVIAPSVVYAVTQSMETWVITPWVQSESVRLHPVLIIVALLVGGSLAGIVGLILAIPLTASGRMLYQELLADRVRDWLERH